MSAAPADVFLFRATGEEPEKSLSEKAGKLLERLGFEEGIGPETFVALKIHFGEKGNKGHIRPAWLKDVITRLKRRSSKVFLTDTNTLYLGRRSNAPEHLQLAWGHGFKQASLNIPVLISDGLIGEGSIDVSIDGPRVSTARIASGFQHVDRLLCLSHFTGHVLTGFGATLKNLGMGCASRAGKLEQHADVHPWVEERTCRFCKACFALCPANAIVEREGRAAILDDRCIGCGECLVACKFGAIKHRWDGDKQRIQEKMAEYALAARKLFPEGAAFLNFLIRVTKECDCMSGDDPSVVADLGILGSLDPVALDRASVDLINRSAGRNLFEELQGESGMAQLRHGELIGLGSNAYRIIEVGGT